MIPRRVADLTGARWVWYGRQGQKSIRPESLRRQQVILTSADTRVS